ncbi:leucine-rich repeat domain-containing protein [Treponema sp. R80B11-R83G3]
MENDDELVVAKAEDKKIKMECFITKDGIERKAELEDILPLIHEPALQYVFKPDVYLAGALAFATEKIKNMAYRNLSRRIRSQIEEGVKNVESYYKKNDRYLREDRAKLISYIGETQGWNFFFPEYIVWRKTKSEKDMSPVEKIIKEIEEARDSESGRLSIHNLDKFSKDDIHCAFEEFQTRRNELQKIKTLDIDVKYLPAFALLFETGAIEELDISGEFKGTWPLFLENCRTLKSISLSIYANKGTAEFPTWIRNVVSLQSLSINTGLYGRSGIASIPDWIGDLQSLTYLRIDCGHNNSITLPDSIGGLKNLTELYIYYLAAEKLPDFIGSLSSLKKLYLYDCENLKTLPDNLSNLTNLEELYLYKTSIEKLPESIGALINLYNFSLTNNKSLKYLPDGIGALKNLARLDLSYLGIEKLPDSIGDLSSLTNFTLSNCENLNALPDTFGNLKNMVKFYLDNSPLEKLPDSIGDLANLSELYLIGTKIKCLPDSIGALKKLVKLDLCDSAIEKLPCTITDCPSLEFIFAYRTNINSFPDFAPTKITFLRSIALLPTKNIFSYRTFCNCYFKLAQIILQFHQKARREGLLALEDEIGNYYDDFFIQGIRLVVDGTDAQVIKHLLTLSIEREHGYYKKKLMEIAFEGIMDIQSGTNELLIVFKLATLVDIKNNPLNTAIAKYFMGDIGALNNIDFKSAIQPEEEREEVRFIKRAMNLCETARREGLLALDNFLDQDGIEARDVFEYGLPMIIDGWDKKDIDAILDELIALETDPVLKNIAIAKKDAIKMIQSGENRRILLMTLLFYFDDSVKEELLSKFDPSDI